MNGHRVGFQQISRNYKKNEMEILQLKIQFPKFKKKKKLQSRFNRRLKVAENK